MGRIKRILILCRFEFFDKGEGRHKRIQVISPLSFWKREKRDTKRIQAVRMLGIIIPCNDEIVYFVRRESLILLWGNYSVVHVSISEWCC